MSKVINATEMQKIDEVTTREYGISGIVLMENAGREAVKYIENYINEIGKNVSQIKIFCGKGNNGGDGLVIGRCLANKGYDVNLYLVGKMSKLKDEALINAKIFKNFGNTINEITSEESVKNISFDSKDIIIDAILGNGINGSLRGNILDLVKKINNETIHVISIDLPTGLPSDFPAIDGEAIKAKMTLAIGLPKISEVIYPTRNYVGELKIVDIGLPEKLLSAKKNDISTISKEYVEDHFPKRACDCHKGNVGSTSIIAGSVGMSGAAILCSKAAFYTGVGYVKLGLPKSINIVAEKELIETLTYPLEETDQQSISIKAMDKILEMVKGSDTIIIGPGLSSHDETSTLVQKIIKDENCKFLIDADGLNALAKNKNILENNKKEIILTPHIGEMVKLTGIPKDKIIDDPIGIARTFAKRWNAIIVLKSASTIIASPTGKVFINVIGNNGMATAGSGDVLSGIIGGFMSQNIKALDAAVIGTWIHSAAGDLSSLQKGKNALLATDILEEVPVTIRTI